MISALSFGHVNSDFEDDFMTLPILNVRPLRQASIYESFQHYQPLVFQRQVGYSITETSHEAQKQLSSRPKMSALPKPITVIRRAKRYVTD